MDAFIINTSGNYYFVLPVKIGKMKFPAKIKGNKIEATEFPSRTIAERISKKYKLINSCIETKTI